MASTYTTDLAIQLMATGENAGTWGQITNTNLVVIQQAIAGYESISIAGGAQTTALVMTQNALATARNAVLKLTGTITGNQIVTVPNGIEKTWIVSNGTVGAFTVNFKYASTGTGQTWTTTDKGIKILYSDGTDIQVADLSTLSGQIVAAQITNSTITQAKLASNSIGTAQLQTNAVTAVKITQSTITQSKLAANSVGANQLISTGVTAASYTSASITVDADGRITAASSGAAGGGAFQPKLYVVSSGPGTYTKTAGTNFIGMWIGSGGGGGGGGGLVGRGGTGGVGAYGWFSQAIPGNTAPYSVGAGGNAGNSTGVNGNGSPGGAGGSTVFGNTTFPGGNGGIGGPRNTPGAAGNAGTNTGMYFAPPANQKGLGSSAGSAPFSSGGGGGRANPCAGEPGIGAPGSSGFIFLWENTGV
jgi:hypothetical protein